ncbi:MAG: YaeQ family protein [Thermoanaerobaculia bacterium]
MALTATIYNFDLELADSDRGVYESLAIRAALHPSETPEFLWTRVLAYCLEYEEGIAFSKGVSDGDEPAVWVRDPAGKIKTWIEVGSPDAERLHKAAKAAERVAVYTHKEPRVLLRRWEGERIHRAGEIPIYAVDRQLLAGLVEILDRRLKLHLSVTGGHLYIDAAGRSLSGTVEEHRIGTP